MTFTVTVRGIPIVCNTVEDVEALIEKFGSEATTTAAAPAGAATPNPPPVGQQAPKNGGSLAPDSPDYLLLKALRDAGEDGVASEVIHNLLPGSKGRGFPAAMRQWAMRVGIGTAESEICEKTRLGTLRGWRLSRGALQVARMKENGS